MHMEFFDTRLMLSVFRRHRAETHESRNHVYHSTELPQESVNWKHIKDAAEKMKTWRRLSSLALSLAQSL